MVRKVMFCSRIVIISLRNCPVCPDCPRFWKYIRNLNSWRKVLKSRTIGTKRTNNDYLCKLISLRNCPVCPVCPQFLKYIRNLNSWRKVLKSGTKGTNGTQMFLSGRFIYSQKNRFLFGIVPFVPIVRIFKNIWEIWILGEKF